MSTHTQGASSTVITLSETVIRQDAEGRYCLNDLHKAAGGEDRYSPNRWTRTDGYQALVSELTPEMAFAPAKSIRGGSAPGTYVVRELVFAYATWISPAFFLKVLRTFDAVTTGARHGLRELPLETITPAQQGELYTLICERFPEGRDRPYAFSRFNRHFRISSYKLLPASRFDEACAYIPAMPGKNGELAAPAGPDQPVRRRWLLTLDHDGRESLKPVPQAAILLDPTRAQDLETLVREFIPGELLPGVIGALAKRTGRLVVDKEALARPVRYLSTLEILQRAIMEQVHALEESVGAKLYWRGDEEKEATQLRNNRLGHGGGKA